jgi:hypothetical protein
MNSVLRHPDWELLVLRLEKVVQFRKRVDNCVMSGKLSRLRRRVNKLTMQSALRLLLKLSQRGKNSRQNNWSFLRRVSLTFLVAAVIKVQQHRAK